MKGYMWNRQGGSRGFAVEDGWVDQGVICQPEWRGMDDRSRGKVESGMIDQKECDETKQSGDLIAGG